MKNKILISKDALPCSSLPTYGNTYWNTPNIDALAEKGTVFRRHYTAAASTAMAFRSMATGIYSFETECKTYKNEPAFVGDTLFDIMYDKGYDCHIAWDITYTSFAQSHFKCEGKNTTIHSLDSIIPAHTPHIHGTFDDLTYHREKEQDALAKIQSLFTDLSKKTEPIFLWIHLPHVLNGRNAYGSDIDLFDQVVGFARELFGDDCLYISADHGHMNGWRGKFSYGFDLDESAIRIPLITPRIDDMTDIEYPTSNTQLAELFCDGHISKKEFVYSETAYYVQPKRKICVIHGNYKFVYDKETKKKYLFDVIWDPEENFNLYYPEFYDTDRACWYSLNQRFFYPYWEQAHTESKLLNEKFQETWRTGTFLEELYYGVLFRLKMLYSRVTMNSRIKNIVNIGK